MSTNLVSVVASASQVVAAPDPTPEQSSNFMAAKLSDHAATWHVAVNMRQGVSAIAAIDTRSPAHQGACHVPGTTVFSHRTIDERSTACLTRSKVCVTSCDGIVCNGGTRVAWKLAKLDFWVKEMLGGLDLWIRDGQPVARPAMERAC